MRIIPFIAAVSTLAAAATANPNTILRYIVFAPAGLYGDAENPNVDGVAMVRYNANTGFTSVSLVVRGLQGGTTYGVIVGDAYVEPFGIQTNPGGSDQFAAEFPFPPFPENPAIQIFKYDGLEEEVDIVTQEELRAVGVPI